MCASADVLLRRHNQLRVCSFTLQTNFEIGRFEQSIVDYTKLLDDPNCKQKYRCYYNRGNSYRKSGRFQEAADDLKRAIEVWSPHNRHASA